MGRRRQLLDGQGQAPFFQALVAYADEGVLPFHTPGHKQGRGAWTEWERFLGANFLRIDVSDVLASPDYGDRWDSVRGQAEALAAEAFGAEFTWFLANGTTAGLQAMVMATCQPGDKVLLPRRSHRSAMAALVLAGAEPVYLESPYDSHADLFGAVTLESARRAWESHSDARALMVTHPTYEGVAGELDKLVAAAHQRDLVVLVDEAHGPHFGFHPSLPAGAMASGADLCAQSTHKLLGSLTQASMLHGQGQRIDPARIRACLSMLETSSPSALLLASLDVARRQAVTVGETMLAEAIDLAHQAREAIHAIPGLACPEVDQDGHEAWRFRDPTKLWISVRELGLSGAEAAGLLRRRYNLQVEMAGFHSVLALITLGDSQDTVNALVAGLSGLAAHARKTTVPPAPDLPPLPRQVVPLREAVFAPGRTVPLAGAFGHVAADIVCPYPPGVPVLCPGEEIGYDTLQYVQAALAAGIEVRGLVQSTSAEPAGIRVLADTAPRTA